MGYEDILFTESSSDPDFGSLYPNYIELMGDEAGNFWILDIAPDGSWGPVYNNCHETAVIIRHSDNLLQFLQHLDEWLVKGKNSHVESLLDTVYDIWKNKTSVPADPLNLTAFPAAALAGAPEDYIIADHTHQPNKPDFPGRITSAKVARSSAIRSARPGWQEFLL